MANGDYTCFTVVFAGDVRELDGNPLRWLDTPFGDPVSIATGNALSELEFLKSEYIPDHYK